MYVVYHIPSADDISGEDVYVCEVGNVDALFFSSFDMMSLSKAEICENVARFLSFANR